MLRFLPPCILGCICMLLFWVNCFILPSCLFILIFFNLFIPKSRLKCGYERWLNEFPRYWGTSSMKMVQFLNGMKVEVRGAENLNRKTWYMMMANHNSFSDILLLHLAFDNRVSPLRFFMKNNLKYIPFIGQVCLVLGYPLMKRHTKSQVAKNPKLKGSDLEATKRACERFKKMPMTIISFPEGTRYRPEKARIRKSPFKNLLKPKAGGVAFALGAMQDCLEKIIDVTIVYDTQKPLSFLSFYGGAAKRVIVEVKEFPITEELIGDYESNREHRVQFQAWLNQRWQEKDERIGQIKKELTCA